MHEIAELADECSVFRNGRKVATYEAGTKSDNEVVELMIGREYGHAFPPKPERSEARAAAAGGARARPGRIGCATSRFTCDAGEIVGLGGLDGQGQRELLLALFGVLRGVRGRNPHRRRARHDLEPAAAKGDKIGMALIPEDRKTEGLMLPMTVRENLTFASLRPDIARRLH